MIAVGWVARIWTKCKFSCTDFWSLWVSFHLLAHFAIWVVAVWRLVIASVYVELVDSRAVSSANVAVTRLVELDAGMSAVYRRYSRGPKTLLCGTPCSHGVDEGFFLSMILQKYCNVLGTLYKERTNFRGWTFTTLLAKDNTNLT